MIKRADLGLKNAVLLFKTNSCTLLKTAKKCCAQCKNDKTCWSGAINAVLLFGQTCAICWKELKSGVCTQCKNNSTCWARAENAVLYKLVHFAENKLKPVAPRAKMTKRADLGLFWTNSCTLLKIAKKWCAQCENDNVLISGWEILFCTNSCTLLKIAKKWCAKCENDKTSWSRAENAVLYKLVRFAEKR